MPLFVTAKQLALCKMKMMNQNVKRRRRREKRELQLTRKLGINVFKNVFFHLFFLCGICEKRKIRKRIPEQKMEKLEGPKKRPNFRLSKFCCPILLLITKEFIKHS